MARGPAACIQVERAEAAAQKQAVSISQSAVQQARVLYLSFVAEFLRTKPRMMIPPTARAVEHTVKYLWTHHTETKERDRGACVCMPSASSHPCLIRKLGGGGITNLGGIKP